MNNGFKERILYKAFLGGVRGNIKGKLNVGFPENYDSLFQRALRIEENLKMDGEENQQNSNQDNKNRSSRPNETMSTKPQQGQRNFGNNYNNRGQQGSSNYGPPRNQQAQKQQGRDSTESRPAAKGNAGGQHRWDGDKPVCSHCGGVGHIMRFCEKRTGGGQQQKPPANYPYKPQQQSSQPQQGAVGSGKSCIHCGRGGHTIQECRTLKRLLGEGTAQQAATEKPTQSNAMQSVEGRGDSQSPENEPALVPNQGSTGILTTINVRTQTVGSAGYYDVGQPYYFYIETQIGKNFLMSLIDTGAMLTLMNAKVYHKHCKHIPLLPIYRDCVGFNTQVGARPRAP
jgi:hypothetical protein